MRHVLNFVAPFMQEVSFRNKNMITHFSSKKRPRKLGTFIGENISEQPKKTNSPMNA